MPDPVQEAADRGELAATRAKTAEQYAKALQTTERRWIVQQAVELTKAHGVTPAQFREICEFMAAFVSLPPAGSAPEK